MKLKGKRLLVFAIVALLCIGYAAWVFASSPYNFEVSHDDPVNGIVLYDGTVSANTVSGNSGTVSGNSGTVSGNSGSESTISANTVTYGADIGFKITGEDELEVEAYIKGTYSGEDVTIPDTVTYMDREGVVATYKVVGLQLAQSTEGNQANCDVSKLDATMTVPEDLRTIYGNLFNWNVYSGVRDLENEEYCGIMGSAADMKAPDTDQVLTSIPAFISDHYEDGAYYLGKCLVRVDPEYEGDFAVKEGTVCVLASAFEGCKKIDAVTLPESVEFIGMRAFTNSSVTSVNLPKGMIGHSNQITDYTFYRCDKLKNVTFDEGVTLSKIEQYAFMDCSALTGFEMEKAGDLSTFCFAGAFDPAANVKISLYASQFKNTISGVMSYDAQPAQFAASGIKEVTFLSGIDAENQKLIDEYSQSYPDSPFEQENFMHISASCFYNCTNLDTVNLSDSVSWIEPQAFERCINLKADVMGNKDCNVGKLGYRCFAKTGLTTITIPESLYSFDGGVFAENPDLTTVNWYCENLSLNSSMPIFAFFNDCTNGGYSLYMTDCTTYSKSDYYGKQPEKNGNTFIETLHIYSPIAERAMVSDWIKNDVTGEWEEVEKEGYQTIGNFFSKQPYLKNVYIHNEADEDIVIPNEFIQFSPALKTVEFDHPECVKEILKNAFAFCPRLNSFPFDKMTGLEKIYENAFILNSNGTGYSTSEMEGWKSGDPKTGYGLMGPLDLTKCVSLEKIDNAAFQGQFHITSLSLNEKTSMEKSLGVFDGCTSLKTITTEGPLIHLGGGDTNGLYDHRGIGCNFTTKLSKSSIRNYFGEEISVIQNDNMPANDIITTITARHAKEIPVDGYFSFLIGLKYVTLGEVEKIPNKVFNLDVDLKKVSLPDTTVLGNGGNVFYGCHDITLEAPNLTTVNASALRHNGIRKLSLPKVTTIEGIQPFEGMIRLEKLELPSLTEVGNRFFSNYSYIEGHQLPNLREVDLPSVKTVEDYAFAETALETVNLPNAETIGDFAFYNSPNLQTVSIPKAKSFGNQVNDNTGFMTFASCPRLQTVELGEDLKNAQLADYMFAFSGLESFAIPENAALGKFMFYDCDSLQSLTVGEGVKQLSWFLCNECDELTEVTLPTTLEEVSWAAFKNTPKLTEIVIPASVIKIDDDAFAMYRKTRDKFEITLLGAPYICNDLSGDDEEFIRRRAARLLKVEEDCLSVDEFEELIALKPIPDGSVVLCADEKAYDAADSYKQLYADELSKLEILRMDHYKAVVNNGDGDGEYVKGAKVAIRAEDAGEDKAFEKWISSDVTFANDRAMETLFVMPDKDVTIYAVYRDKNRVASPVIDPAEGIYESGQILILSSDTVGADIYYTTDGTEPSVASTRYTRPVMLSKTAVIKAIAVKDGMDDSSISEATVTIKEEASVTKAPEAVKDLVENGKDQTLVTAGSAEGGTIVYAVAKVGSTPSAGSFEEALPTASDAGFYTVWYKVQGDATHSDTRAMPVVVRIAEAAGEEPAQNPDDGKDTVSKNTTDQQIEQPKDDQGGESGKAEEGKKPEEGQKPEEQKAAPKETGTVLEDTENKAMVEVISGSGETPAVSYKGTTDKTAKDVTVPDTVTIDGVTYDVKAVADGAFKNNGKVEKITIGKNVETIGKDAFAGCKKLKSVTIGENVTEIGSGAFKNCKAITKVVITSEVKQIGAFAFKGMKKLKQIIIKTTKLEKKKIHKNAFKGVGSKVKVKVPKAKKKAYITLLRKKGLTKKNKIK